MQTLAEVEKKLEKEFGLIKDVTARQQTWCLLANPNAVYQIEGTQSSFSDLLLF